jgi:hypothetical protein
MCNLTKQWHARQAAALHVILHYLFGSVSDVALLLARFCWQAKAQEEGESVLQVTPVSGVVAPYSKAQLNIMFRPQVLTGKKGFRAQQMTHTQEARIFDYLVQVRQQLS